MDGQIILDSGLQSVPEFSAPQVIYLDFDGESAKYEGEILAIGKVTVQDSGIEAERAAGIAAKLNEFHAGKGVIFVTDRPAAGEYSTIYVGKSGEITEKGDFAGLSESVDYGNKNSSDNAFVLLDASASDDFIVDVISHEAGHLLGTIDHGGEGLSAYAYGKTYNVSSGDVVSDVTLTGDTMVITSGGYAYNIEMPYGTLKVSSGGSANGVYMSGGSVHVAKGGTLNNLYWTPCEGGIVTVDNDASVTYADLNGVYYGKEGELFSSASTMNGKTVSRLMYVTEGGTAGGNIVSGGRMIVMQGGNATGNEVQRGIMDIAGGVAYETKNGDTINVSRGGTAAGTLNSGLINVLGGGAANNTVNTGRIQISSGGSASGTELISRGTIYVNNSGTLADTTVNYGAIYVSSGALAVNTWMDEWGILTVYNCGSIVNTTIGSNGSCSVASGASAYVTTVSDRGTMNISGTASNTRINSTGAVTVAKTGLAIDNMVSSGGKLTINGGIASRTRGYSGCTISAANAVLVSTTIYEGGKLTVSGGSSVKMLINGGSAQVNGNVFISGCEVADSGTLNVSGAVSAFNMDVTNSAVVKVGGKASLKNVDITSSGVLELSSGVLVNSAVIASKGAMTVAKGAVATNTVVSSGGSMTLNGTHRNGLVIADGAVVSAGSGAVIEFALEDAVPGSFMVIGLDKLQGAAPAYTITAAKDQAAGNYYLAVASDLSGKSITMTIGNGEVQYGKLVMGGEELYYRDKIYTLSNVYSGTTIKLEVADYNSQADLSGNDIDGNGLSDIILVHDAGFAGTWLSTGDPSAIKAWGDLSNIGKGISMLGTGNVYASADAGNDVFFTDGSAVGAWIVEDNKVTGYKTVTTLSKTSKVLGLGDFDGDNITDVLLTSTKGDIGCTYGNGEGWHYFKSLGDEWNVAAIGDLNGDGRDDMVLRHDAGFAGTWLAQADGSVKWANLDTLDSDTEILGTGDFNGDGVDDVLLKKGDWVGAWIVENGSAKSIMGIARTKHTIEQIADFDGDGVDDLRIRTDAGDIGVLYVKGADTTSWQYYGSLGDEWKTNFSALA